MRYYTPVCGSISSRNDCFTVFPTHISHTAPRTQANITPAFFPHENRPVSRSALELTVDLFSSTTSITGSQSCHSRTEMDPRYPTLPFSHPQPQQTPQEPRYGPIPPSPFASQPSQRTDTLHKNDPFLRRRVDLEERRQSPSLTNAPQSYILPHALRYPSTAIPTTQDATTSDAQLRRSSFSAAGLWGDARGDRLALHAAEGMEILSSTF